jgi:hypothetical protein
MRYNTQLRFSFAILRIPDRGKELREAGGVKDHPIALRGHAGDAANAPDPAQSRFRILVKRKRKITFAFRSEKG